MGSMPPQSIDARQEADDTDAALGAAIARLEDEVATMRARVRQLQDTPAAGTRPRWKTRSNLIAALAFAAGFVAAYAAWMHAWEAAR